MTVVVDDLLLLDVLAGRSADWITDELETGRLFTTSSWYYRLARAAAQGHGTGSLSGRLGALAGDQQDAVLALLADFALLTDAAIAVATDGPLLRAGAGELRIDYRIVA